MSASVSGTAGSGSASVHGLVAGASAGVTGSAASSTTSQDTYPTIIINGKQFFVTSASIKQNGQWRTYSFKNLYR